MKDVRRCAIQGMSQLSLENTSVWISSVCMKAILCFVLAEWNVVRGEPAYFSTQVARSGMRHSLGGWQLYHV
jgi:hypothetical protein